MDGVRAVFKLFRRLSFLLSALLAYFGNKKRGGGGSSSAAPSLKPQQLKGMERWLGLTGRDECRDNLQRSALILAAMQGGSRGACCSQRVSQRLMCVRPCAGDVEAVKLLVEHGYDVNGRDANMLTPLHYASWKGTDTPKVRGRDRE